MHQPIEDAPSPGTKGNADIHSGKEQASSKTGRQMKEEYPPLGADIGWRSHVVLLQDLILWSAASPLSLSLGITRQGGPSKKLSGRDWSSRRRPRRPKPTWYLCGFSGLSQS